MVIKKIDEEKYTKEVFNLLKSSKMGLSITELTSKSPVSRTSVRIALAYMLGKGKINFKQTGMAKVYYVK